MTGIKISLVSLKHVQNFDSKLAEHGGMSAM